MAKELATLQPGDSTRVLDEQVFRDEKTQHVVKTAQRVWLDTGRSGTYMAELKDSRGNVVGRTSIDLVVPSGGSGAIEMRLQVYPVRVEEPE